MPEPKAAADQRTITFVDIVLILSILAAWQHASALLGQNASVSLPPLQHQEMGKP